MSIVVTAISRIIHFDSSNIFLEWVGGSSTNIFETGIRTSRYDCDRIYVLKKTRLANMKTGIHISQKYRMWKKKKLKSDYAFAKSNFKFATKTENKNGDVNILRKKINKLLKNEKIINKWNVINTFDDADCGVLSFEQEILCSLNGSLMCATCFSIEDGEKRTEESVWSRDLLWVRTKTITKCLLTDN